MGSAHAMMNVTVPHCYTSVVIAPEAAPAPSGRQLMHEDDMSGCVKTLWCLPACMQITTLSQAQLRS